MSTYLTVHIFNYFNLLGIINIIIFILICYGNNLRIFSTKKLKFSLYPLPIFTLFPDPFLPLEFSFFLELFENYKLKNKEV